MGFFPTRFPKLQRVGGGDGGGGGKTQDRLLFHRKTEGPALR